MKIKENYLRIVCHPVIMKTYSQNLYFQNSIEIILLTWTDEFFSYQVETCPVYLQSNENNFNEKI